jgi:hypothetical protein
VCEVRLVNDPSTNPSEAELERVAATIRSASAEVKAPAELRDRVDDLRGGPAAPVKARPWWTRFPAVATATVAVAAAVLAIVVLPGGGDPSVTDAAALAEQPAAGPAPAAEPDQPALLATSFEGLSYPDWEKEFGWRAVGERTDELDGRDAHTVFYENGDGARIGYTIVAGDALDEPSGADRSVVDGVELAGFKADGANGVTWLRDGHTCVLAGEGVERSTLLKLAAWKGDGAVTF